MQPPKRDRSDTGVRDQFGGDRGMMTTRSVTEATGGDQSGVIGANLSTPFTSQNGVFGGDVIRDQFGNNSERRFRNVVPHVSCVVNNIPEAVSVQLNLCHPVLCAGSEVMVTGTAFQLVMGPKKSKVVRGVYLSPTEWYIEALTRPMVVTDDGVLHLDLKKYPGSHIPVTKSDPALWATMCLIRIDDPKVFDAMVRKIDTRIIREIYRRMHPEVLETSVVVAPPLGARSRFCTTCSREFPGQRGFERHACTGRGGGEVIQFECGICKSVLTTQAYFDRHIAKHHGGRTSTKIMVHELAQGPLLPIAGTVHAHHDVDDEDLSMKGGAIAASPFTVIDCTSHGWMPLPSSAHAPAEEVVLPRRPMIYDEIPDDEEGLSGTGILAIVHTWDIGQEFMMFYKEKDEGAEEYEAHGMLLRWDVTDESPGPVVCYLQDGHLKKKKRNKHHYHEEHMDCTSDFVVLRLVRLDPTTVFDPKRRKMNQSTKPE